MKRIVLVFSVLAIEVVVTGCSGNTSIPTADISSTAARIAVASPSETAKPDPIETPVSSDPRNATDNALVNQTIIHLLNQDLKSPLAMVEFNQQPCTTMDGLGGPPKCAEGVVDGTMVTFLPVIGPGEGSYLNLDEVEKIYDYQDPQLYQVILIEPVEFPDEVFPEGSYAVILAIEPNGFARTFRLNGEGSIVRVDYTAWSPVEEADRITGEVLYK